MAVVGMADHITLVDGRQMDGVAATGTADAGGVGMEAASPAAAAIGADDVAGRIPGGVRGQPDLDADAWRGRGRASGARLARPDQQLDQAHVGRCRHERRRGVRELDLLVLLERLDQQHVGVRVRLEGGLDAVVAAQRRRRVGAAARGQQRQAASTGRKRQAAQALRKGAGSIGAGRQTDGGMDHESLLDCRDGRRGHLVFEDRNRPVSGLPESRWRLSKTCRAGLGSPHGPPPST